MDGRCGTCKFSQECETVEQVECHRDTPRAVGLMTPNGPQFVTMFPRMPVMDGWCGHYEEGMTTPRSRLIKVGSGGIIKP